MPGVSEVFQAHFIDHAYPPHTHDTWTVFIVDAGAIRYNLDRHTRGAEPPMVTVLPPGVVHDGRPATAGGFRKRVLYIETTLLDEDLVGAAVDQPVISDPALRWRLATVHGLLRDVDDALEAETRLTFVVERLQAHLGRQMAGPGLGHRSHLAEALRAFLDERLFETVTLAGAGASLGASAAHLVRAFGRTFGIPPHTYVLGRRIEASRTLLLDGRSVADVAVSTGFYDQSHFTRHFKRHLGITPGRYATRRTCGRAEMDLVTRGRLRSV